MTFVREDAAETYRVAMTAEETTETDRMGACGNLASAWLEARSDGAQPSPVRDEAPGEGALLTLLRAETPGEGAHPSSPAEEAIASSGNQLLREEAVASYERQLHEEEKAAGTIEMYLRILRKFLRWLGDAQLTPGRVAIWKQSLRETGLSPATVNTHIAALNHFLHYIGKDECRVRSLRIQRSMFRRCDRDLSKEEYKRLLAAARRSGRRDLALIMETICATGIRVSELHFITVEAVLDGRADISLKGTIRTILILDSLARKLLDHAERSGIATGEIFRNAAGGPMDRRQIWAGMKALCAGAGIAASKVFPHNLRHLFATLFYKKNHDIVELADILGHANIATTRIYLITTGEDHVRHLEELGLVT